MLGPALITWAGAAAAIAIPGSWWLLVVPSIIFGVVALTYALGPHRVGALIAYGSVFAAMLLVTGARIGATESHRVLPVFETALTSGEPVELRVTLTDFPSIEDEGIPRTGPLAQPPQSSTNALTGWVTARVSDGRHATSVVLWMNRAPHGGQQSVPEESGPAFWAPGTVLQVSGQAVKLEPTSNAAYGVRVTKLAMIGTAPGPSLLAAQLRSQLRTSAATVSGAALVPGFAVGDTTLVTDEIDVQMKTSSLTHLVAVSGANCALVTTAAIWALSWLGCGRRVRAVAAACALTAFVTVVGPDASVQRAAVMGAVLLASGYGGKRSVALPALGIAVSVLLIADPWQAWQPGFALSVAATGGIILVAPALTEAVRRIIKIPRWLALPVAVAAAAQLACGPLLLLLQDGIPAAGLIANVLAGPAAPAGTALGLAALVTGPAAPGLSHGLVVAASVPARWVEETARVTSSLPGARWEWVSGVPGALLLAAVETAAIVAWLLASGRLSRSGSRVIRPWLPEARGPWRLRLAVAVLIGAAAGVFLGPTVVGPTVQRAGTPADWRIVACDVGQGDAVLVRGPDARPGEAMLVDTGDDERLLRDCLGLFGVTHISLLVLTHDDRDHVGAVDTVTGITDAIIVAPATRDQMQSGEAAPDRPLLDQLEATGVPWSVGGAGESGEIAGASWLLLAPDPTMTPAAPNDASLVMRADLGTLSVLLLADTGEETQARFMGALRGAGAQDLLHVDVVKVAHHGSRDQHPAMYASVGAQLGLVSSGVDNSYGHPARDTLAALRQAGTRALRTDELGSVAVLAPSPAEGSQPGMRVWASRGRDVGGAQ